MTIFLDDRMSGAGSLNGHTAATGGAWATDTSLWSAGSASNSGSPDDFLFDGSVSAYKSAATPGSANYRVDYDVKMVGAGNGIAAVFARWSTGGSGYQFGIEEGSGAPKYTLRRYNSGSIDGTYASTSSSYTPDTSVHQISIEVLAGGVVKGYFDGTQILTFTDASPITSAGYVAVGGREFRLSDAIATDDTGGGSSITADQGSFALTGQTVGLLFNRSLTADQGAYALTGQDVTLTKATPGAFVLTADAGQYIWTGEDALADYAMNGEQGSYALSGQDVTFTRGFPQAYTLTADAGSYTFNGQNARLDWSGAPVVPNRQAGIYMGMRIGL